MKKTISFVVLALFLIASSYAQKLSLKENEVELTKDAQKASKKGELSYGGSYWNTDQSEMYSFYLYQPKKSPMMMDVAVFDSEGNYKELRTEEFSPNSLSAYNLEVAEEISNNGGSLAGKKVGYFKRPTFPGKPKLNIGYFENRYTNGLWTGYEFEEEEDMKIGPKFWPFFTVALGGDQEGNDNYKLAKVNKWGRLFQGNRTYISLDERAVIGGQKAEMKDGKASIFYLGIFNMATKEWESSQDINMGAEILPGLWAYHRDDDGNIHCLVGTKEGFYVLQVDREGNLLYNVPLSIPSKGNGKAEYFTFKSNGKTLYVAGAHYSSNQNGGDPAIGISKVENGKEVAYMNASNEELSRQLKIADGSKVKFNKERFFSLDRLEEIPSGYILFFSSVNRGTSVNDYAAQFSKDGKLEACYASEAIEVASSRKGGAGNGGHVKPIVALKGNKLYWLSRNIPEDLQKGVYFDTDYEDLGYFSKTTVTTMRNDETYQKGSLVVLDLDNKTISNQIMLDEVLVGANPMQILQNGDVLLNALDTGKGEYKQIVIQL